MERPEQGQPSGDAKGVGAEARRQAHDKLSCPANAHLTLNDIRGMDIQSHDIVDAFREMLAAPEYRSRRLAFVVANTLARSQVIRALESRTARWFTDPAQDLTVILLSQVSDLLWGGALTEFGRLASVE